MYENQKNVWFSDLQFEIVWFSLFRALEQDVWNSYESVLISDNVWKLDMFRKCWNPNVRISDIYCIERSQRKRQKNERSWKFNYTSKIDGLIERIKINRLKSILELNWLNRLTSIVELHQIKIWTGPKNWIRFELEILIDETNLEHISIPICLNSKCYVQFSDTLDFYNAWKPDNNWFSVSVLKLFGSLNLEHWNWTSEIQMKVSWCQTTSEKRTCFETLKSERLDFRHLLYWTFSKGKRQRNERSWKFNYTSKIDGLIEQTKINRIKSIIKLNWIG